ncbi:DUF349 domain-containing protein [Riemerella anatipestifer]|uniref:DUF349 domain-containing protein n=1 Tax=Riemerella anatipestifer TaxID=34085 RepID=A0AAP6LMY4_RIEAN|nr:DUF349 domain-containing protein [Riemerella anatipestifer]MCD5969238.1 DUF349 domain-containing protein [Riemerella anatipestifer]MCO7355613.1 DUF349 domain-containing protein [Riemerella anatipestifer]MCU7541063.1 DUF349 domain-containing protein [Riemerella anatipestifer]MCU7571199.1 DUF349 domain-containing protein [Riemerella anatipestifer]MCU7598083.1 DUF349 domain-containing protein [Riemerella anatipestifer]
MNKETLNSGQEELNTPQPNQEVKENTVLETSSYQELEVEEEDHDDDDHEENEKLSLKELVDKLEKLINLENAGEEIQKFNALRKSISEQIDEITENKKQEFEAADNDPSEVFSYEHPLQAKFSALVNIFKEKRDLFIQKQEEEHQKNLEVRLGIVEKLKNLYTNTEPGIDLFKAIREIKEAWANAGKVAKSEFKNLNNNYYHHLNGFYQMLDLNKEYREQEYAHNLEKRQHIIARAKELLVEPLIQKALNELQYLHKLWREEAEPVAEEFRDSTWEEFKEISNQIHDRKTELFAARETEQKENLEKKNAIIAQIKALGSPEKPNHNYWQKSINKMEELREEFIKLGSVPRKLSTQNWTDFKQSVRAFNSAKNEFYKGLKQTQINNLEEKYKLIKVAQDNKNSEDWETMVPLFKKLQKDWQAIGHVPRSQANKVWDAFREACNYFFDQYRTKSEAAGDDWNENFKQKKALLEELKKIEKGENSLEIIEDIKNKWNAIGKVPKDKLGINSEFNKTLKQKLKLNNLNEFDIKEEGLSESQITDRARKLKNQITDLEAEVVKLENNLSFFNNPTRENPLLKDTFEKIDDKRAQLESLRITLHQMISGE